MRWPFRKPDLARMERNNNRRWLALLIERDPVANPALSSWEREILDRWIAAARAARTKETV